MNMTRTPGNCDLFDELIVDNFAGGGGASMGIELAISRPVDVAVNHDAEAVAMHRLNHPHTQHHTEDVFRVDPVAITGGRPVGLAWFSPDCKHFSRAKGGKPVSKKIRGLAWIVVRWARRVRPRIIALENVQEFEDWGPVGPDGMPCRDRRGQTFRQWVDQLERCGYRVEWRMLRACDYGAPTIRRRLFLIARRDGMPIVWPEPSHGDPASEAVRKGRLEPWPVAADCIDWSIPCPSIFGRRRPLAPNTMRRIARGINRFVIDHPRPFLLPVTHAGDARTHNIDEPMRTITSAHRGEIALAAPYFVPRHGERSGQDPSTRGPEDPMATVTATATANGASLVAAFLAKHFGGNETPGAHLANPISTVTAKDHHALVAAHWLSHHGTDRRHQDLRVPAPTTTAGGSHASLVAALMAPYYGSGSGLEGRDLRDPSPTVTATDRLQLVTVTIDGQAYVLTDIGMRMLQPHELFRAQGFPQFYVHDRGRGPDGTEIRFSKSTQVRLCGNSVCPQLAEALVRANVVAQQQGAAA